MTRQAKSGMMVHMSTTKSNNEQLRDLIEAAQLKQEAALAIFNKKLGPAAYSLSAWKAFMTGPDKARYRPFSDALLEHAKKVFEPLIKKGSKS